MLTLYSTLVCAQEPTFQQRRHPMHSGQHGVRVLAASSNNPLPMDVACGVEAHVRRKAVGDHHAAGSNALLGERGEAVGQVVADDRQPDSAGPLSIHLNGNGDGGLLADVTTSPARFDASHKRFVDFDLARELIATRAHHRSPQFVEPHPGGLIATEPQDPLQPQGTGAILLSDHPPHHLKPQTQGLAGPVEDGPGCSGCLVTARHAVHPGFLGQPRFGRRTSRATEPLRLPQTDDVLPAGVLGREAAVELGQRTGITHINHADRQLNGTT